MAAVVVVGIVPVARGDDLAVVGCVRPGEIGDGPGDRSATGNRESAAFAEVILNIDDD